MPMLNPSEARKIPTLANEADRPAARPRGIGVAGRAADLLSALENDQRALVLNAKVLERIFRRIEIDLVDHKIRLFLLDLLDNRALLPACGTPGGGYIDEDRFAGCLGLLEGLVVEWLRSVAHY